MKILKSKRKIRKMSKKAKMGGDSRVDTSKHVIILDENPEGTTEDPIDSKVVPKEDCVICLEVSTFAKLNPNDCT